MSFKIIGTGMAHPALAVTNSDLSKYVDTSDEWISSRTGIKSRFISTGESMLDLSVSAAKTAVCNSGLDAGDLDLIICTTMQGDYVTPSLACLIQRELGAACPAFDINAACSGFIFALDAVAAYFDAGRAENILIVSVEMMSKYLDWNDRATCVLFGDGAGAAVLAKGAGLRAIKITAKGDDELLFIPGNTGNSPFAGKEHKEQFLHMTGSEVFKFAVSAMIRDITDVLAAAGIGTDKVKKVIPHQANLRIIRSAAEKLNLRDDQLVLGIDRYGNTSSASIPILLSELFETRELESGDIVVLSAFGGGLTTGACVIEI